MARYDQETQWEQAYESSLHEAEDEQFLGGLARGIGGLLGGLGEGEDEFGQHEFGQHEGGLGEMGLGELGLGELGLGELGLGELGLHEAEDEQFLGGLGESQFEFGQHEFGQHESLHEG